MRRTMGDSGPAQRVLNGWQAALLVLAKTHAEMQTLQRLQWESALPAEAFYQQGFAGAQVEAWLTASYLWRVPEPHQWTLDPSSRDDDERGSVQLALTPACLEAGFQWLYEQGRDRLAWKVEAARTGQSPFAPDALALDSPLAPPARPERNGVAAVAPILR